MHRIRHVAGVVVAAVCALVTAVALAPAASAAPATQAGVYVALGDSYASGTGTRSYFDPNCQKSNLAYPALVAPRLGATLVFAACSGARVPDVRNQLASLSSNATHVTVSVGGNDAGFANVITQCALPFVSCNGQIDTAQNYIRNTLPGLLDGLYAEIRTRAPSARVLVIGYPRLFNGEECNFFARISRAEQTRLNQTADLLATTTSGRAAARGFGFVDTRAQFTGHAVCDDAEWINGLSNPIGESYHPKAVGHAQGYTPLVAAAFGVSAMPAAVPTWAIELAEKAEAAERAAELAAMQAAELAAQQAAATGGS